MISPKIIIFLKKYYLYCIASYIVLIVLASQNSHVRHYLDEYASKTLQEAYGSRSLAPEQEAKIVAIAHEMGIHEPITIRKMNSTALRTWGYHNALACFSVAFNFIPLSNKPFMFVSEGFLEDLSPEEQRFLIGHEMIHIKERHTLFLNLVVLMVICVLVFVWYRSRKYIKAFMAQQSRYHIYIAPVFLYLLLYFCVAMPNLMSLYYRRHIEKVADIESLKILQSHNGFIQLLDRWEKDFSIPLHQPYYDLLSDHPSNHERRTYCLNTLNNSKETL